VLREHPEEKPANYDRDFYDCGSLSGAPHPYRRHGEQHHQPNYLDALIVRLGPFRQSKRVVTRADRFRESPGEKNENADSKKPGGSAHDDVLVVDEQPSFIKPDKAHRRDATSRQACGQRSDGDQEQQESAGEEPKGLFHGARQ
jgi:hypothetical protein